ncbi:MAG: DMT family transporter [Acidobacteria bacterium]|nr:DMT family transporter [Acidobacteriota bacterium]
MSERVKAEIALALVCALWGTTFVVVKEALHDSSVFVYMALRFGLAAVVTVSIFWKTLRTASSAALRSGFLIGLFLFAGYTFQNNGLIHTSATKSAFITGMAVVLVPLFLGMSGAGRVNRWIWAGALISLGGLYFLTIPAGEGLGDFRELNRGDVLTLCASSFFAIHLILIGRATKGHPVSVLSSVQFATTAILSAMAIPAFSALHWEPAYLKPTNWLVFAVLLTGIAGTAVAFSIQVWAQRHIPPTYAGILLTLEPVFASLTAFVFKDERLGMRAWIGAAMILTGILLAELKGSGPTAIEA